jgi:transcriptional/translational regulatory protein YebC/TACO1
MPEVRSTLTKNGGRLADPGSVMFQFARKGVIFSPNKDDELILAALDAGAEDAITEEDGTTIYTSPSDLAKIRTALIDQGFEITEAELQYVPTTTTPVPPDSTEKVTKLLESLDDLDDVTAVHTNAA